MDLNNNKKEKKKKNEQEVIKPDTIWLLTLDLSSQQISTTAYKWNMVRV